MAAYSVEKLLAIAPEADEAILEKAAASFELNARRFDVSTALRRAHFVAQVCHESAGFTRMTENLSYSAERIAEVWHRLKDRAEALAHNPEALANAAYADRLGNGNEASGDGWRYRGRGFIQLTGKDNYRDRSAATGIKLVSFPDRAADPDVAAVVALAYWRARGCNAQADSDSVEGVTRLVNGPGLVGLEDRRALTAKAKEIFADEKTDLIA